MESIDWPSLVKLFEIAGPVGIVVIALAVIALFVFKTKGWSGFGDQTKMIATNRIDQIDNRLGNIEKRIGHVEADLEDRPTKEEFHEIKMTLVRIDERDKGRDGQIKSIQAGVSRVEDFLISLSKGK